MAFYRKKPVVIEAIQWHNFDNNYSEIVAMNNGNLLCVTNDYKLLIPTLEGTMTADVGDFIIKGVNGELYPCKPDIFAKSYEKAE